MLGGFRMLGDGGVILDLDGPMTTCPLDEMINLSCDVFLDRQRQAPRGVELGGVRPCAIWKVAATHQLVKPKVRDTIAVTVNGFRSTLDDEHDRRAHLATRQARTLHLCSRNPVGLPSRLKGCVAEDNFSTYISPRQACIGSYQPNWKMPIGSRAWNGSEIFAQ